MIGCIGAFLYLLEAPWWQRQKARYLLGILVELEPVDPRRFMYGRD